MHGLSQQYAGDLTRSLGPAWMSGIDTSKQNKYHNESGTYEKINNDGYDEPESIELPESTMGVS
jgi:hypothetical protein